MSIPASNIVEVIPRVIKAGGQALELNGLVLTKDTNCPIGKVLFFNSSKEVTDYFGVDSTLSKYAPNYFKGFDNSFKKPRTLYVVNGEMGEVKGYLRGASKSATLEQLKATEAGDLNITISGTAVELTEIDLTSVNSFSDVANIIQEAIVGKGSQVSVEYSSLFNAFVITDLSDNENNSVAYAEGSLAPLLGWDEASGGVISQHTGSRTLEEILNSVLDITSNWVSVFTDWTDDNDILAIRTWANSFNNRYWAIGWVNKEPKYLDMQSTGHIAETLKMAGTGAGNLVLGIELAFYEAGMIASVNYDAKVPGRGKITYMFKSQSGIMFNVSNEADAKALEFWGISFYGDWATANDQFRFFAHGNTWGQYPFIDTAIDAIWLNNCCQLSLMTLLTMSAALPYNQEGYSRIRSTLCGEGSPVAKALANGVIRAGVTLNATQRDQVDAEAGLEIHQVLETSGYYVQVLSPDADVRQHRGTPEINLWYTDGGAIQKIEMASTVIL